uniref:Uncharacterized protein n=1 Tax=Anguilla anguilla TaxID=7936 RepID=A0A0E9V6E2_ANGAN
MPITFFFILVTCPHSDSSFHTLENSDEFGTLKVWASVDI